MLCKWCGVEMEGDDYLHGAGFCVDGEEEYQPLAIDLIVDTGVSSEITGLHENEAGRSARGTIKCPKCKQDASISACSDVGGVWVICRNCGVIDLN